MPLALMLMCLWIHMCETTLALCAEEEHGRRGYAQPSFTDASLEKAGTDLINGCDPAYVLRAKKCNGATRCYADSQLITAMSYCIKDSNSSETGEQGTYGAADGKAPPCDRHAPAFQTDCAAFAPGPRPASPSLP